jgi:hypothetical protein
MAKKPKEKWQVDVRNKLELMGIGYKELAIGITESTGITVTEATVNKAMCTSRYPGTRKKICEYLEIEQEGA